MAAPGTVLRVASFSDAAQRREATDNTTRLYTARVSVG
jgi:hypothetical protein